MVVRDGGLMPGGPARGVALVLSPHPDDELLGAPAHLLALRDAGWRIVNLAVSLGSDERARPRRLAELELACERVGFELELWPRELTLEEPGAAVPRQAAVGHLLGLAARLGARLLVAPSPHDDHPAHERAGRLAVAGARAGAADRLWLWGLWADIALASSLCVFDERRLKEIEAGLQAHAGELERNDYLQLLRARAQATAILGPERVFGHGSPGLPAGALAEALCDVTVRASGELLLSPAAIFDGAAFPAPEVLTGAPLDAWLDAPSPRRMIGARASQKIPRGQSGGDG